MAHDSVTHVRNQRVFLMGDEHSDGTPHQGDYVLLIPMREILVVQAIRTGKCVFQDSVRFPAAEAAQLFDMNWRGTLSVAIFDVRKKRIMLRAAKRLEEFQRDWH